MTVKRFSPFKNEVDTLRIDDLNIDNRFDRISLYGSLEITLDLAGLEAARALMDVLTLAMHEMAHTNLPNKICASEPETVRKQFP